MLSNVQLSLSKVSRVAAPRVGLTRLAPVHIHARSRTVARAASVNQGEVLVEEIMMPHPVLLKANQSCKEAARVMLEKDISGAPVVDDKGCLVGVISESDLMWKGAGAPLDHTIIPPIFIGAFDLLLQLNDSKQVEEELHKILAKTVGEAMTSKVISIEPTKTMAEAAQLMLQKKVNRLPVVEGKEKKVVGVLTRHDVLRGMVASKSPYL